MTEIATTAGAAALGWVAGMRSATPPALLARAFGQRSVVQHLRDRRRQPARALAARRAAPLLAVAALGEMLADKLPIMPDRTSPPVLAGRVVSGAVAGAALAVARRQPLAVPALVGAAGAVVSSYAMMALRRRVGERLAVPDTAVALAEDGLALGIGAAVVQQALG